MQQGYTFERVKCPECGKEIADNWFIRHMEKEHPAPVTTKSQPWTGSPEQFRQCDAERIALHFYGTLQEIEAMLYDDPQTDRESRILAIIVTALNLTDREIEQREELSNAN